MWPRYTAQPAFSLGLSMWPHIDQVPSTGLYRSTGGHLEDSRSQTRPYIYRITHNYTHHMSNTTLQTGSVYIYIIKVYRLYWAITILDILKKLKKNMSFRKQNTNDMKISPIYLLIKISWKLLKDKVISTHFCKQRPWTWWWPKKVLGILLTCTSHGQK